MEKSFPHPTQRVRAELYKKWWEIPTSKADAVLEVPALAMHSEDANQITEIISNKPFHKFIVYEGELYQANLESMPHVFEWENTVFMQCDGYAVFNDMPRARSESKLMNTLSQLSVEEIEELSQKITDRLKERESTI